MSPKDRRPPPAVGAEPDTPAWKAPPELEFDPEKTRAAVLKAAALGAAQHHKIDREYAEDKRRDAQAVVLAKIVIASLPWLCETAALAGQTTADVYDIHVVKDVVPLPGMHHTAVSAVQPKPQNLRGTAWLVYHACEAMGFKPEIRFYIHESGDKGGYKIVVAVPHP